MQLVTGIGGVFLRAQDPEALTRWYADVLGVANTDHYPWQQQAGPTVWAPFPADTDYFGRRDQAWMVNFRVSDLDAVLTQLRSTGAEVNEKVEDTDIGRFGWAHDPEGNRFELWQPKDPATP